MEIIFLKIEYALESSHGVQDQLEFYRQIDYLFSKLPPHFRGKGKS